MKRLYPTVEQIISSRMMMPETKMKKMLKKSLTKRNLLQKHQKSRPHVRLLPVYTHIFGVALISIHLITFCATQ